MRVNWIPTSFYNTSKNTNTIIQFNKSRNVRFIGTRIEYRIRKNTGQ